MGHQRIQPKLRSASFSNNVAPAQQDEQLNKDVLQSNNPLSPQTVMQLQRTLGNQATIQLVRQRSVNTSRNTTFPKIASNNASGIQRDEKEKQRLRAILDSELQSLQDICAGLYDRSHKILKNLSRDTGGKAVMGPLKKMNRIKEKADKKIQNGEFGIVDVSSDIKDILRATIVYDDFDQLKQGYQTVYTQLKDVNKVESFSKISENLGTGKAKSSGYRDAKIVFNWKTPDNVLKNSTMLKKPKVIPMEIQFNTRAALAVKEGHLFDSIPGYEEWDFRFEDDDGNTRFDARGFVDHLASEAGSTLFEQKDWKLAARLPEEGLVPEHDAYEPKKLALMSDEDKNNAQRFYPKLYDLAFRYNNWTASKGDEMQADVGKLKKRAEKSGLFVG